MSESKSNKKKVKKIVIDPSKINIRDDYPVPKALQSWHSPEELTQEFLDFFSELLTLSRYIAQQLNEGEEVSESIAKRASVVKAILKEILDNTFLSGHHRFGILVELMLDTYMSIYVRQQQQQRQRIVNELKKKMGYVA